MKISKCKFRVSKIDDLGDVADAADLRVDLEKLEQIEEVRLPLTKKFLKTLYFAPVAAD